MKRQFSVYQRPVLGWGGMRLVFGLVINLLGTSLPLMATPAAVSLAQPLSLPTLPLPVVTPNAPPPPEPNLPRPESWPPLEASEGCDTISYHRILYALDKLRGGGYAGTGYALVVDPKLQRMFLLNDGYVARCFVISTSRVGMGNVYGSTATPPGLHYVREMIGDGAPLGAVFRGRDHIPGDISPIYTDPVDVPDDLVTTRILWLSGLEPGVNQGPNIDTYQRYIYIHGTPEEGLLGTPASHGCVRMYNREVSELYSMLSVGTRVYILPIYVPGS